MYTKIGDKMIYKLIDFGFSCLQWNQLQIKTSLQFPEERPCFKEGRDLAQLIYYLIYFQRDGYKFSARLNEWMRKRLFVNYAGSRLSLSNWISTPREIPWPYTYGFFNRNSVRFLASNPQQIRNSIHALPFVMGPAGPVAAASGPAVSGAASFLVPAASGPAAAAAASASASSASNVEQRKYTRSRKHKKVSKIIKSRKRRGTHR
jgi:hypothetical protein